eukprot:1159035-Pelagomonas_calceolata.AAC.6
MSLPHEKGDFVRLQFPPPASCRVPTALPRTALALRARLNPKGQQLVLQLAPTGPGFCVLPCSEGQVQNEDSDNQ